MRKLIALEWDETEARVLEVKAGSRLQVLRAITIPLDPPGDTSASETPAECLARHLRTHHLHKSETIISIGRAGTEMRLIEVPNAPPDEFPSIVRFQSLRQFAAMNEDWTLDYVPLSQATDGNQVKVVAAAISPQLTRQINEACDLAGLRVRRMLFRPFLLATILHENLPSEDVRICVDVIGEEADLVVLNHDRIAMVRTIRMSLAEEQHADAKQLINELRRTLVAYGNQARASEVKQIVICGGEEELPLANDVKQALGINTTVLDPFQQVQIRESTLRDMGDRRGRFAALVGAVLESTAREDNQIDFLNPRKPPAPVGERRRRAVVAASLAVVVLAVCGFLGLQVYLHASEAERLRAQVDQRRTDFERANARIQDIELVQQFADGAEMNWLAELDELSRELPADGVVVNSLGFRLERDNDSYYTIQGVAAEPSVVRDIESNLRDERHTVQSEGNNPTGEGGDFPWTFGERVIVMSPPPVDPVESDSDDASGTASDTDHASDTRNDTDSE